MSGSEGRKSGRPTVRHKYDQVNEAGFADDESGNPSGLSDTQEGAISKPRASTSDETLALLENELKSLDKEEEELKKEAQIAKLKKKIQHKKKSVADLRGETSLVKDIDSKVSLKDLRENKELRSAANQTLNEMGLVSESSDSDSESSSESEEIVKSKAKKSKKKKKSAKSHKSKNNAELSDSSSDESSTSSSSSSGSKKKHRKHKKKSGISAKSSDHVKYRQKYPQAFLRFEHVNSKVSFDSLDMNLFVAGELEIISNSNTKEKERKARLELLKRLMYLSGSYEFNTIKALYAAIIREIELGHKKWGDDFHYVETNILARSSVTRC